MRLKQSSMVIKTTMTADFASALIYPTEEFEHSAVGLPLLGLREACHGSGALQVRCDQCQPLTIRLWSYFVSTLHFGRFAVEGRPTQANLEKEHDPRPSNKVSLTLATIRFINSRKGMAEKHRPEMGLALDSQLAAPS